MQALGDGSKSPLAFGKKHRVRHGLLGDWQRDTIVTTGLRRPRQKAPFRSLKP